MSLYKVLSVLLGYPSEETVAHIPVLREALNSSDGEPAEINQVASFLDWYEGHDLLELQRRYVATFDLEPRHSLHLTHHLFGDDNRERGPALIDLRESYRAWGVQATEEELPDYLPLMLEFCSLLDGEEARLFLAGTGKVLSVLADNLEASESPWSVLVRVAAERACLRQATA